MAHIKHDMDRKEVPVEQRPKRPDEVSALDIRFLLAEWEQLQGAFIRKIYHTAGKDWKLLFELFVQQKGTHYLHVFPSRISLNKHKGVVDDVPTGFCMNLRKHLSGKRIEKVSQHGFDRIVEISAGGLKLILEFVPPGNVILTDSEGVIISALTTKKWRDREIRVRGVYHHPPGRPDPFSLSLQEFSRYFKEPKKAAAVLAADLGFGSEYANILCNEAGVRPDKSAFSLTESELKSLFGKMPGLGKIQRPEVFVEVRDKDKERIERIALQRSEALEKWKAAEKSSKEKADAIYRKFDTVQALLEKFSRKKDAGFEPIEKREGLHITAQLDGVDVQLDLKMSAQDNAAFYYDQSKKAKRKIAGLDASMRKPVEQISREEPQRYPDQEAHKQWYEKFKWFHSSDGTLVIAGKNAEQNELILGSHALEDEWCFHADIRGAAFTVIKSGAQEPSDQTKREAAEFAAINSKAWTKSHGNVTVFSVQRKNLSKTAPAGMHVPQGSFVVFGQKVWYRNIPLRIAIGADLEGRIRSGPESAVRKSCPYVVMLTPGNRKASDLSRDMKSILMSQSKPKDLPVLQRLSLEELGKNAPFGFGEIAKK